MHDKAGRLVEHDEIGVLVEDRQRDVLGLRHGRRGLRHRESIGRAGLHGFGGIAHGHAPASCHPVQDQVLDPGPGKGREALGQEAVETLALVFGSRDDDDGEVRVVEARSVLDEVGLRVVMRDVAIGHPAEIPTIGNPMIGRVQRCRDSHPSVDALSESRHHKLHAQIYDFTRF